MGISNEVDETKSGRGSGLGRWGTRRRRHEQIRSGRRPSERKDTEVAVSVKGGEVLGGEDGDDDVGVRGSEVVVRGWEKERVTGD